MRGDAAAILPTLEGLHWHTNDGQERACVTKARALEPNLIAAHVDGGSGTLAREASKANAGQWWVGNGAAICNRGGRVTYVVDWDTLPAVNDARSLATRLGLEPTAWTTGALCRQMLKWIGTDGPRSRAGEARLLCDVWGYRRCQPGSYAAQRLVDMSGAYWQAVCRLPSPRLSWLSTGPCWHPLTAEERDRWQTLLLALAACKPVRNALWGCMTGRDGEAGCWCKGEKLRMRSHPGPFRTAGLAVARAVYELCWLQAEEGHAVYANTDSLILHREHRLAVWDAYGYAWREKAEGDADIRAMDTYKVGAYATVWYHRGSRLSLGALNAPMPPSITLTEWH